MNVALLKLARSFRGVRSWSVPGRPNKAKIVPGWCSHSGRLTVVMPVFAAGGEGLQKYHLGHGAPHRDYVKAAIRAVLEGIK